MLLPIRFKADWARIKARRQEEMLRNNERENRSRIPHNYQVGDKILLDVQGIKRKLRTPVRTGPYTIQRIYSNGTIRIQRGAVTERVNIRRVSPYFDGLVH